MTKHLIQKNKDDLTKVGVVMLDLQPSLLGSIEVGDQLVDSCILLSTSANQLNYPILITEQVPHKLGSTVGSFTQHVQSDHIFSKSSFSAFGCEEFCEKISKLNLEHLVISGVETSICVYLTALDARNKGLEVTVVSDCVGCRRTADGEVALSQLRAVGVSVISLETFLFSCLGSAEHNKFREVSSLIKSRVLRGAT